MKIVSQNLIAGLILTYAVAIFSSSANVTEPQINITTTNTTAQETSITLSVELAQGQLIFADSIDLSLDTPGVTLSKLEINKTPKTSYDANFNEISTFSGDFAITCQAKRTTNHVRNQTNLHFSFLLNTNKHIFEKIYPIELFTKETTDINIIPSATIKKIDLDQTTSTITIQKASLWERVTKFSAWLQGALRTSQSWWLRLLLVFLLGLLMSLTPCIYPMIPITAGILQAQGSSSIGRSFLLAFIYTLGTSTTFAVFGLIAASTGHLFGQLLVSPLFILVIVVILAYLGLSMFGLYDMYVPKFMEQNTFTQKQGSLLSVFLFGAVSGSIASPCLSPGLALLLSIVATLGNNFLGFMMLFVFGLGLSVPLLIIGTFSNSMNIIPHSGTWMIEIKKIFGFMLLTMCIYLLNNILPPHIIAWFITLFVFGSGVYYLQNACQADGKNWYYLKNSLGCALIMIAMVLALQTAYQTFFVATPTCEHSNWLTDYELALKTAADQRQNLLIDCGADWCSICKAIDKFVFEDPAVKTALCDLVLLKVDATDQNSEPYLSLKNQFKILGVPTVLLVDPNSNELLNRWGSDLYDLPKTEFIKQIKSNT